MKYGLLATGKSAVTHFLKMDKLHDLVPRLLVTNIGTARKWYHKELEDIKKEANSAKLEIKKQKEMAN